MSGICGVIAPVGQVVTLDQIAAMTSVLERRGPDGTHHWLGDRVALGHALLATTPEALEELQPVRDQATGCVITADVRLDNRDSLILALEVSGATGKIGDGDLILRAYIKWGEACLEHLLGDFAFAIWDPRNDRLFCARDHMGMRQLIYTYQPEEIFAFATEPRAILTLPNVPHQFDEGRIADYLEGLEGLDVSSTFFEGLNRLPPAHYLTFDAGGCRVRRYWSLVPGPELKLDSDEEYAKAFLEVLGEAVRCRLRTAGPAGAMLSGGIDSGSVVAVASRLLAAEGRGPLATFSAVGPSPDDCKETRSIHAALAMPGLDPHLVNHAELEPYIDELIRLTRESDEPFDAHMILPRAVYLVAHRAGMKVVLDGVGGDSVLSSGAEIARQLRLGRWRQAWRNIRGEQRFWGPECPFWRQLFRYAAWAALPDWLRRLKASIGRVKRRIKPNFNGLTSASFAHEIGLIDRKEAFARSFSDRRFPQARQRACSIAHPNLVVARERYDRVAASCALEARDPFLDIRLLAFCLSLPSDQLLYDGWPKMIARRAMSGILPDAVRWRTGKEHLGWDFAQSVFSRWPSWREPVRRHKPVIARYVKRSSLENHSRGDDQASISQNDLQICFLANWHMLPWLDSGLRKE